MIKVLIIGQNGQVSTYLQRELIGDYKVVVADRSQLDLLKLDEIQGKLESINPDIIINPAAYTAVDLAEKEQQQADAINHLAVNEIADYCALSLIHI